MPEAPPAVDRQALLLQCRTAVERRLWQLIGERLDALPPKLEEASRAARDLEERSHYSRALASLHGSRDGFRQHFVAAFDARFDVCVRALAGLGAFAHEPTRDELAAMRTNMVENEVAIGKLAAFVKQHATADLAELSARFATLFRRPAVDDADNPVGPLTVARGLYAGVSALGIEGRALRAVRSEFEQHFVPAVGDLYKSLNAAFAKNGVQPSRGAPSVFSQPLLVPVPGADSAPSPTAIAAAEDAIAASLDGVELPPMLDLFLRQTWSRVLARAHAASGPEGEAWREAVDTMEALAWSVQPKPDAAERAELARLLPPLLKKLTAGMEGELDPAGRKLVLDELMARHQEILRQSPKAKG